ncbi:MAG TPA: hypothetical protein VGM97_20915 [Steroidobacteraceae bacterium]|jgi:hypothetical protein
MNPWYSLLVLAASVLPNLSHAMDVECSDWQTKHPTWLWCDDFESDSALETNYFDVNRASGRFGVVSETAYGGTHALRNSYAVGVEDAGGLKLSFGKTPVSPKRYTDRNFDDVYWRFYMKTGPGWVGQPLKVTRATVFVSSNWAQAAIGHLWEDNALGMGLDPASGVSGSSVVTTGWNDFPNLKWLGKADGKVQVYAPENREKWYCVEVHMKLNTPGASDGTFEFWIDDQLQANKSNLNWRGGYTSYGINALTLEGWVNDGAARNQSRYFDNLVVSTNKIGCYASAKRPNPPENVNAQ